MTRKENNTPAEKVLKDYGIEKILSKIIKKYKKEIISILFEKDGILLIVNSKSKEIYDYCKDIKIKFNVISFQNYLGKIISGDKNSYLNLSKSEILYDPGRFLDPLQELIEEGRVLTTDESLKKRFDGIKDYFKKIDMTKYKVLDNIYCAVLDLSQALLIEKHGIYCTQRETIKYLEKYFVKTGVLSKDDYGNVKNIILLFKKIEHKKRKMVSGKELDDLQKKAERYREKVISILENKK
ncbi:hypothetical protein FJZ20_01925 [Candidatus Pacearchaeota archaeon]|nr:hypothetical protein [Candidatus Pacearchaeota archaeon]